MLAFMEEQEDSAAPPTETEEGEQQISADSLSSFRHPSFGQWNGKVTIAKNPIDKSARALPAYADGNWVFYKKLVRQDSSALKYLTALNRLASTEKEGPTQPFQFRTYVWAAYIGNVIAAEYKGDSAKGFAMPVDSQDHWIVKQANLKWTALSGCRGGICNASIYAHAPNTPYISAVDFETRKCFVAPLITKKTKKTRKICISSDNVVEMPLQFSAMNLVDANYLLCMDGNLYWDWYRSEGYECAIKPIPRVQDVGVFVVMTTMENVNTCVALHKSGRTATILRNGYATQCLSFTTKIEDIALNSFGRIFATINSDFQLSFMDEGNVRNSKWTHLLVDRGAMTNDLLWSVTDEGALIVMDASNPRAGCLMGRAFPFAKNCHQITSVWPGKGTEQPEGRRWSSVIVCLTPNKVVFCQVRLNPLERS